MKLRRIGFFHDLPTAERRSRLTELVRYEPHPDAARIVGYLQGGLAFGVSPGVEEDVLREDRRIVGPVDVLTDGVWAWPRTLAYWVSEYNVELLPEFIDHMSRHGWQPPEAIRLEDLEVEGMHEMS